MRNIVFSIVFGIRGYVKENEFKMDEICKNAINCATHILQEIKDIAGVKNIFVGISTGTVRVSSRVDSRCIVAVSISGIVCCGVIGHQTRKHYAIIGLSINKAEDIMDISLNKVTKDSLIIFYDPIFISSSSLAKSESSYSSSFKMSRKMFSDSQLTDFLRL
jgi:hypothetical protein